MTTSNPRNDPLDDLLSEAFQRDIEQVGDVEVAARVMRTIKQRSRARAAVLGVSMAAGFSLAATLALPGLAELAHWLGDQAAVEPSSWGMLPVAALLAVLTPWLFSLVDDRV
jgi:hypothetical protein